MAWAGVSLATGGNTPKASQVSMMMFCGMSSQTFPGGVGDVADGVGGPGVFRQRVVIQVQAPVLLSKPTFSRMVP